MNPTRDRLASRVFKEIGRALNPRQSPFHWFTNKAKAKKMRAACATCVPFGGRTRNKLLDLNEEDGFAAYPDRLVPRSAPQARSIRPPKPSLVRQMNSQASACGIVLGYQMRDLEQHALSPAVQESGNREGFYPRRRLIHFDVNK